MVNNGRFNDIIVASLIVTVGLTVKCYKRRAANYFAL